MTNWTKFDPSKNVVPRYRGDYITKKNDKIEELYWGASARHGMANDRECWRRQDAGSRIYVELALDEIPTHYVEKYTS